jgi:hypothetical protein
LSLTPMNRTVKLPSAPARNCLDKFVWPMTTLSLTLSRGLNHAPRTVSGALRTIRIVGLVWVDA